LNKLRALQVITKGDWAGAQRVVYEICKYIKENRDNEIDIEVAVGDNGLLVHKISELGIKVYVLKFLRREINPYIDYKGFRDIKDLISKGKYDVVHCHSTKAGILGRLAANKLKVEKVIYTVHGFWPICRYKGLKRNIAAMIERFMVKRTTHMVYISKSDIKIAKYLKIYNQKISNLIYNSITLPQVVEGALRSELNIDGDVRIIGNISRVDEQKNPLRFVKIANEYFKQYPDNNTLFIWIGDGPLMDKVNHLIDEYGMTDKVLFIGFRDYAERYMVDFNLLIMTSYWEGVPITILEAIAYNIPILSSDVGGISEIIGKKNVYDLSLSDIEIASKLNSSNKLICFFYFNMPEKYLNLYISKN
jgi:glycosyltransferase involved in cell wall biosynthesis